MASIAAITGKTLDDATSISETVTTSSGNMLLCVAMTDDGTVHSLSMSDPDWELIYSYTSDTSVDMAMGCWRLKELTTGASEPVTVNSSVAADALTMHIIEINGANAVAEVAPRAYRALSAESSYRFDSVKTYQAGALVLGVVLVRADDPTPPSGYVEALDTLNQMPYGPDYRHMMTCSKTYAAAGNTGPVTGSLPPDNHHYVSLHIALSAQPTGGTAYGDIFRDHVF